MAPKKAEPLAAKVSTSKNMLASSRVVASSRDVASSRVLESPVAKVTHKPVHYLRQIKAAFSLTGPVNFALFFPAFLPHAIHHHSHWLPQSPLFGHSIVSITGLSVLGAGVLFMLLGFWLLTASAAKLSEADGTISSHDPPKALVTSGPYAYIRNPVTYSIVLLIVGEGVLSGEIGILVFGGIYWVSMIMVMGWEETDLKRRFGGPYGAYWAGVGAWIPRCTPWEPGVTSIL